MENHIDSNDDVAEYYSKLLLQQIVNFHDDVTKEREKYIAALSHFICSRSDAYQYNLTYLIGQHAEFGQFLCAAQEKYQRLKEILTQIAATPAVREFLQKSSTESDKVKIVLNDFLEGDLTGNIRLTKEVTLWGAERRSADDVLTVDYGTRRRSGPATKNADELEKMMATVLRTLEQGEDEEWKS